MNILIVFAHLISILFALSFSLPPLFLLLIAIVREEGVEVGKLLLEIARNQPSDRMTHVVRGVRKRARDDWLGAWEQRLHRLFVNRAHFLKIISAYNVSAGHRSETD
jgi:hypothetical protein